MLFSLLQMPTSRIGNNTWLIHTLLKVMTIHTNIHIGSNKLPASHIHTYILSPLGRINASGIE